MTAASMAEPSTSVCFTRGIVAIASAALAATLPALAEDFERAVAVAWNTTDGGGFVRPASAAAPFGFTAPPLATGGDVTMRLANGRLYVVSRVAGTVTVVSPATWSVERVYEVGASSEPLDIALVGPSRAYLTRAGATRLLRLDLDTGATHESTDLSPFADADGVPDLGTMASFEGRVFVQIRRMNVDAPDFFVWPPYLAVVDSASEALVDVDPSSPGVQAIELEGTAPKLEMQLMSSTRRLFVGATGKEWDAGGIEAVDLDALASEGLVIREADEETGVDLGAFVMVPDGRGYLTFTTDLTLSSHLTYFTLEGGPQPGQLAVMVDYWVPTLLHDPRSNVLFMPDGTHVSGLRAFDADTGVEITPSPIATNGPPTDLELLCDAVGPDCPNGLPALLVDGFESGDSAAWEPIPSAARRAAPATSARPRSCALAE